MRARFKRLAEQALIESGIEGFVRKRQGGRILVLAYHNVLADRDSCRGDRSLHLPVSEFAKHLDAIVATHEVVPLDAVMDTDTEMSPPRVAITFDDAYHGALTTAVPELTRRGLPATIFVAPAILGTVTWWDSLAERSGTSLSTADRDRALTTFAGKSGAVFEGFGVRGSHEPAALPRIGSEADVITAAAQPGISIGSHTWSHWNLSVLGRAELQEELERPLEWLRQRVSSFTPWLSYPYGMFNSSVEDAARVAGYRGAFKIDGGSLKREAFERPHALNRLNVPAGLSLNGLRLRLAGLSLRR